MWAHVEPAYVPYSAMNLGKNALFPRFWALFAQKIEKNCNFCAKQISRISPIICHDFAEKVLISSIFVTFLEKSWKKVQFLCKTFSKEFWMKLSYNLPKWGLYMSHKMSHLQCNCIANAEKSSIFCTFVWAHIWVLMSRICPIFWAFPIQIVLKCWKKCEFSAH